MGNNKEIDLHKYFLKICNLIAQRSKCGLYNRHIIGAMIVKDKQILSTGYNGVPRNFPHKNNDCYHRCVELNVKTGEQLNLCYGVHAEMNAILSAAKNGININGSILYTSYFPCIQCTLMIINSGIKKIIYRKHYALSDVSKEILKKCKVKYEVI